MIGDLEKRASMEIGQLSDCYDVRKLNQKDIDLIYEISCKNKLFYQYHPPFVTRESIREDMSALPPGKSCEDKYYIGFFEKDALMAVMDLILDYPTKDTAFIGLFMMNVQYQKRGIGSGIIREICKKLKEQGCQKVRLGVDKGNEQSYSFWTKNNFRVVEKKDYIIMELKLV